MGKLYRKRVTCHDELKKALAEILNLTHAKISLHYAMNQTEVSAGEKKHNLQGETVTLPRKAKDPHFNPLIGTAEISCQSTKKLTNFVLRQAGERKTVEESNFIPKSKTLLSGNFLGEAFLDPGTLEKGLLPDLSSYCFPEHSCMRCRIREKEITTT